MFVTTLAETIGNPVRHAKGPGWESRRMVLKSEGVGYSVHDTVVQEGAELHLHYKHHFETNYCIEGEGEVVDVRTGKTYPLRPGSLYALNENDPHVLRAIKGNLRLVCVFSPALAGQETHQPDGSYALKQE